MSAGNRVAIDKKKSEEKRSNKEIKTKTKALSKGSLQLNSFTTLL